jgi:hypothetical protein
VGETGRIDRHLDDPMATGFEVHASKNADPPSNSLPAWEGELQAPASKRLLLPAGEGWVEGETSLMNNRHRLQILPHLNPLPLGEEGRALSGW